MFLYQKLIDRSTLRQGFSLVLSRLFIAHRRKNAKSYNKQKNPCNLLSYTDFYSSIAYRFFT